MVYKRVFSRTNHPNLVSNGVCSCVRVTQCQACLDVAHDKLSNVKSFCISPSLFIRSSHRFTIVIVLVLCHLSSVCAVPTSIYSAKLTQSAIDTRHQAEANRNRIFRQTEKLPTFEPRILIGFKLEGDAKTVLDNGRYVFNFFLL